MVDPSADHSVIAQPGLRKRKRVDAIASNPAGITKAVIPDPKSAEMASERAELEQQLMPTADECLKLRSVIRMLDKRGVGREELPAEAGVSTFLDALDPSLPGWPHAIPLLEFYLDLASSELKVRIGEGSTSNINDTGMAVDSAEQSTYASALASTSASPASTSSAARDIDHFTSIVRGVLDGIKDAAAVRLNHKPISLSGAGKAKYALHRSIGGSYDVFTSVMDEAPNDDKSWRQMGDTDLLAVYPTELADLSTAPSLGDLNGQQPMTSKRAIELQPEIEPVSFLYYDPYHSFAPTYDSSTSTLSYAQSVSLRESRQAMQAWDNRPLPPLPPRELAGPVRPSLEDTLTAIDPSLFSASETSTAKLEETRLFLRMFEDSQIFDKRLEENKHLLRVLQEAQWHRLRKSVSKATDSEVESAERLLESLTSLANARPRTPDLSDASSPFLSNPAVAASIVQTKPRAYYGTLDKANYKGIPDYVMAKEEGKAKKEGSSLALPELGRKNSSQGPKKSKKNIASAKKEKSQVPLAATGSPAGQLSELAIPQTQIKQETPAA